MWWEYKRLDATTLAQNTSPREVTEDLVLKAGQEGFHARGGAVAGAGLGGDTVAVVLDSELGYLTFPVAVVEDEQGEAGMAEQAPGLSRVRRTGQRNERGVLLTAEVDDQTGEGGEQRRHVMSHNLSVLLLWGIVFSFSTQLQIFIWIYVWLWGRRRNQFLLTS